MGTVFIAVGAFVAYIIAYRTYGRFLARRILKLDARAVTPAHSMRDDNDYVPAKREVLFGHHFTSIAGTGPIVGPAIAIMWGWLPALLWVVFGAILMGAVHDMGALVISTRSRGKSIGDCVADIVGPRVRVLFLLVIFLMVLIVIAIFGLVIAVLFDLFPEAVIPVWSEIPIAVGLGYAIYRRRWSVPVAGIVAVILMYATVIIGAYHPVRMPPLWGLEPLTLWVIVLLVYAFIASVIPVWKLLQPRDYINGHELFIALGLLFVGVLVARPQMVAPVVEMHPVGGLAILPFLFVTVACGAISGFHSLVGSGTSSKQIDRETDALPIGYGAMLLEGFLAVLVLIAVGAGLAMKLPLEGGGVLTGLDAWNHQYADWKIASGLASKVNAFVIGSANLLEGLHIPWKVGIAVMGVFVASFASTTLDTATRIQRYVVSELAGAWRIRPLANRYAATAFAVVTAAVLALVQGGGKGGLILWPLFGTTNQLLAGLTLLVIALYLRQRGKSSSYAFYPMLFMIGMTGWAMVANLVKFVKEDTWHLVVIGGLVLALEVWMIIETIVVLHSGRLSLQGRRA